MQIIKFNVRNQRLTRFTSGVITEGSYSYLKFEFNFKTEDWNIAETKTAVFSYKGKNYEESLDQYNQCRVPKEVIHDPCFKVSLHGGEIYTNTVKIPVEPGSSDTPDTPDNDIPTVGGINILDGGAIMSSFNDDPSHGDDSGSSENKTNVDYIIENNIPFYSGVVGNENSVVTYNQLDTLTANYTEQGFYTTTNGDGKITNAGYQITFEDNGENSTQTFSTYANAKIITSYQYQPAFNQWLNMGFDGTYWVEVGTITKIVNGKEVTFITYAYNSELMGDIITAPEHWRFEVEVL